MTRLLIITTTFILTFLTCFGQTQNKIVYTVDWDYLEGCETGSGDCKPVTLIRQTLQDSIKMIFPSGGTQSDVYLYEKDKAYLKWLNGKQKDKPKPIRHDQKFSEQGNPTIDLTGLPDGKYKPHMLSCGVGGSFDLTIATKGFNAEYMWYIQSLITGQWFRLLNKDTIIETFTFYADRFDGSCSSTSYISTAPIFTLLYKNDNPVIQWHDLLGGDTDVTILEITDKKMVVQYADGQQLEYTRR